MKRDYSASLLILINISPVFALYPFVLQVILFFFYLSNFSLYSLTNFRHALRRVDLPGKSENKEQAANFIFPSFSFLWLQHAESLALGNFNNLPARLPQRRDGVYLTAAFSPCVSVNYILRWCRARLCARGPTWLQRHIRPLLCRSCRNRVYATTKRRIARPCLHLPACLVFAQDTCQNVNIPQIHATDEYTASSLREKRRNCSMRFPPTRIRELVRDSLSMLSHAPFRRAGMRGASILKTHNTRGEFTL